MNSYQLKLYKLKGWPLYALLIERHFNLLPDSYWPSWIRFRIFLCIGGQDDGDDDDDGDDQRRDGGAEVDPVTLFKEPLRSPLVQDQRLVFKIEHLKI